MTRELRIHHPTRAGGFSLIEVLITIVILSFGLLGIASMLLNGMKLNNASYLRSVATQQAYDMGTGFGPTVLASSRATTTR